MKIFFLIIIFAIFAFLGSSATADVPENQIGPWVEVAPKCLKGSFNPQNECPVRTFKRENGLDFKDEMSFRIKSICEVTVLKRHYFTDRKDQVRKRFQVSRFQVSAGKKIVVEGKVFSCSSHSFSFGKDNKNKK